MPPMFRYGADHVAACWVTAGETGAPVASAGAAA
jgi:hypothetical protein